MRELWVSRRGAGEHELRGARVGDDDGGGGDARDSSDVYGWEDGCGGGETDRGGVRDYD